AGEVVVLFQLLEAPAAHPRPRLPPSVRRSLVRSIDWMLVAIVVAAFALHFGGVGYLSTLDFPRTRDPESLPPSVPLVTTRFAPPPVAPEPPKETATETPAKTSTGRPTHHPVATPAPARAPIDRARLAEQLQSVGVLSVLGHKGPHGDLIDR